MKPKTPDKVAAAYARRPPKLKALTFSHADEEGEESYLLIEGNSRALRMLGEMLVATADQKAGFDFHMHPRGGGLIFFDNASTHGIYLNLVTSPKAVRKRK